MRGGRSAEMGEKAEMGAREGASTEDRSADGAGGAGVGDANVEAGFAFLYRHFGDDGNTHARAYHAEEATKLATLEDNSRMKARAVASGDSSVTETVTIAEKKKGFGAEIFQRERAAGGEFVFFGQGGKEALSEKRKHFEFMPADGERENSDIDGAGAETIEKNGSNFFDDGEAYFGEFARERSELRRQEVGRDCGNHTDANCAAKRIFLFNNIAARSLEFTENGAGAWKKSFADVGEANGAAEAVEEADTQFVFKFKDLLGQRRLGDMRLLGGAAEGTGFGDGAKIAELVEFHKRSLTSAQTRHRLCLSIVSEVYIGSIGAANLSFACNR
jgi:hypothetical protein